MISSPTDIRSWYLRFKRYRFINLPIMRMMYIELQVTQLLSYSCKREMRTVERKVAKQVRSRDISVWQCCQ